MEKGILKTVMLCEDQLNLQKVLKWKREFRQTPDFRLIFLRFDSGHTKKKFHSVFLDHQVNIIEIS